MSRLLIVDDERDNLEIIGEYLEDEPYELDFAGDGAEAWRKLESAPDAFDCVLLDRMMPEPDGMEVLKRIKAHERMHMLPVILQTAAAGAEQVAEGVQLGAYYYLSKPFGREVLASIVRAALADRREQLDVVARLRDQNGAMQLLLKGAFEFTTLEQAHTLAAALARMCENSAAACVGFTELLVNAVEHGNLRIGYAEKSRLLNHDAWNEEVQRRLALPENAGKRVHVRLQRRGPMLSVTICDSGDGFDWKEYLDLDGRRAFDTHGRGIALARKLAFASLQYLGNGNTVAVSAPLAHR